MADYERIGIIGAGNMGSSMAVGFSERGMAVSIWDINAASVDRAVKWAKEDKNERKDVAGFHDLTEFAKSLGSSRRLFLFSITHGAADSVLDKLEQAGLLRAGDVMLDAGNEHYRRTERRQDRLTKHGVNWVGMGISGGYQAARRGGSLMPGGDEEAVRSVLPFLRRVAATDRRTGEPCVDYIGPRGSGNYVKMIHNGVETGILSGACEAWGLMKKCLGMENDEIGKVFEDWNSQGELKDNYLIQIGSEICQRRKTPEGDGRGEGVGTEGYVLDDIVDKVVQDADNTEGTFFWSVEEGADRHVSIPTIAASQFFRVASADRAQRLKVVEALHIPQPKLVPSEDKAAFIETLRLAVYASFLCSFCQGLELIARASKDENWNVDLAMLVKCWRGGCIIQSDYISDMLLRALSNAAHQRIMNIKLIREVAADLHRTYPALKQIILKATEWDAYVPSLSASLEYLKFCAGPKLPTQFMEAEMDFFGAHSFDIVGGPDDPGEVKKGKHHYEWRPA
ncbi:6-phosphogluconate dehydrogenase [Rhizodiscina lignyota]|uniref:6-phosphogluconate dehydrogenase, decarboxylating n=1 Tax=Rhizodiscina lignyota TaxID=1504668 RepID=A0A9P4IBB7_9PEZI|nr:6-phosphogluconate dehydrogenase [Rhizodiscina lignyota]